MNIYYGATYALWFTVEAPNKRKARSEGVKEFGRGRVQEVRVATEGEIKYFTDLKGKDATRPTLI